MAERIAILPLFALCGNLHCWGIRREPGNRPRIDESFQFQERLLQNRPRNRRQQVAEDKRHQYAKEGIAFEMCRLDDVQRNFVEQIEPVTNHPRISQEPILENGLNPLPLAKER